MTVRSLHQQYIVKRASGGSDPDPAVFCPLNHYVLQNEEWVVPIPIPDPESEQILLLCDDLAQAVICVKTLTSSGQVKYELLSADMVVLSSSNINSNIDFVQYFPTNNQGIYYVLRITPVTVGQSITRFYTSLLTGYNAALWRILQAKFYTPNLTSLLNGFLNVEDFSDCKFYTNLNSVTTANSLFRGTSVNVVEMPQMNSLQDSQYMFENTPKLFSVKFPPELPALAMVDYMFSNSSVQQKEFPTSLPLLASASHFYDGATIQYPHEFTYLPLVNEISYFLANTTKIKANQYTFPALPSITSATYLIIGSNLKKLVFTGDSLLWSSFQYLLDQCKYLEEVVFPEKISGGSATLPDWQSWQRLTTRLKKIVMPIEMPNFFPSSYWGSNWPTTLEEITTCNDWGVLSHRIVINSPMLKSFWQPNLRVSVFTLGYSATIPCKLTELDIDWANSDYSTGGITIRAQLPTAEINRIFSALPSVAKTIDVRYNPGYAACNKTIATAKGWTVS